MTKEELKALGLTDEQAEKVFEDYGKNYVPKSQFNAKNDELKKSKAEYKALEESKQDLSDKLKSFEVEGVGSGADLKSSITIDDNGGYVFNKHDGTTTDIAGGVDEWLKANLWAVRGTL